MTTRLEEIVISSLGVIESGTLSLGSGFTAITGETGAGKTMVLEALGLLRGERADAAVVRTGADRARVSGIWQVSDATVRELVEDAGGALDDDELILGRTVGAEGRSRAQAGGASVPAGTLARVAERLVAVHGQADQQRLRSSAAQREALDRAAGAELRATLKTYSAQRAAWQRAAAELAEITEHRAERATEAARLREELDHIAHIDPQPGEDEALAALANRMERSETLRAAVAEAYTALAGSEDETPDAAALVGGALRSLEREDDPLLAEAAEHLRNADAALSEASALLTRFADALDAPERSPDEVHARLAQLSALTARYGSIEAALQHGAAGALRIAELDADDDSVARLTTRVETSLAEATALADRLTALRAAAARDLSAAVETELQALAMPNAQVEIKVDTGDDLGLHGRDDVRFLLRPHPGAPSRPIAKGASGGELSRIMLALEVALANDDVPTLVFDEVDAGVGGEAAIEIGRRLATLAKHAQVVVVTHLAQVAAFADTQVRILKGTDGEITASSIARVDGEERMVELARMLSGSVSDTARAHAAELLQQARIG